MMNQFAQDCSSLRQYGAGRVWLCRLLRPTLGKKFFLVFAILVVTAVANGLVVEVMLAKMRGTAALVNVTGSLRWLSQRIQLDILLLERGGSRNHSPVEAHLAKLDKAISVLASGGSAQGIEIQGLPENLTADIESIRRAGISLRKNAERVLAGLEGGQPIGDGAQRMFVEGTSILNTADAVAAALTLAAESAEAEAMRNLWRLGLLNLTILVLLLLAIRVRIVRPLRHLAAANRSFADGRREARSGFRSFDEIGQLAAAFDHMAEEIEHDLRLLAANAAELEKREQGQRKLSLAVEHSPVSVMITDAGGTIEYVNPKFTEITGFLFEEVVGRQPSILKSGQMPQGVYAGLWRRLQAGREWHGELLNRKKNGELFWEDTSISPLKDAQGRITHFIAVKEDITERKQVEVAVSNLNAELERRVAERTRQLVVSNRELEAFSYSISHDLRAPLRGINGFASLMAENCRGCGKTESLEYMARIQRATLRMGSLIDDMLDLSRVARKEIMIEALDLSAMARSILGELTAAEPARRVEVELQDGLTVRGDATLLRAALENLFGNAWKFSVQRDPARITFGCREESGKGSGEQVFFVRDNGAGFDMKYAGKLFGAFQRLHTPQEFEGNGIGLAMVQRIIGLHGGTIWAESEPGEGATFFFTLGVA